MWNIIFEKKHDLLPSADYDHVMFLERRLAGIDEGN
jgi:hypothetical protein